MANKEVFELTAASTLDGTELLHVVQSGNSRKATVSQVNGINSLTGKTTPVDADELRIADSAASFAAKKLTFANLWAWISGKILTLFNASGSAPIYACRAWVNFNGTGTVAIRASGNVSSITDNGTGLYTVNFTTAMQDANYVVHATSREGGFMAGVTTGNITTTSLQISSVTDAGVYSDSAYMGVSVIR